MDSGTRRCDAFHIDGTSTRMTRFYLDMNVRLALLCKVVP